MNKTLFLLLLLVALSLSATVNLSKDKRKDDTDKEADFNSKFGKKYEKSSPEERNYRKTVFFQNANEVNAHNNNPDKTYERETNSLSDLTKAEFRSAYLGLQVPADQIAQLAQPPTNPQVNTSLTFNRVDWTNITTPVKFQGNCGSCWAFSTLAAIQSAYKRKNFSNNYDLSQQELVECSFSFGNKGCVSGWFSNVFDYIKVRKINTEMRYPYTSAPIGTVGTCKNIPGTISIASYKQFNNLGCPNLVSILANYGPIPVAVDAINWNDYKTGVFNNCGTTLTHGVLLVAASNTEWKLKNSFGAWWGEKGFIRLAPGNTCGLCSLPNYVTV